MDLRSQHTPNPQPPHEAANPFAAPAKSKSKRARLANKQKQIILWLIVLILFIVAVGTAAYYVNRYHKSQKEVQRLSSNPSAIARSQDQQLVDQVGKLTVLPKGETPTIATVTDITKLKGQAFFVNAKNGDRALIYTNAKQAFLYRPSTNKLINIAPVNLNSQSGTTSTPAKP